MEFKSYRLFDVVEIIGGGTPKRSNDKYWGGNINWLSVADFNDDFRFVNNSSEKITELGVRESSTKILKSGQIIISARGTVGCIAQLSKPMAFNQSCYGLQAKENFITNDFLYYCLKNSINDFRRQSHGGVFDTITRDTFKYIEVYLPSLDKQEHMTKILGDLDNKIHLNHQINHILEQMAQLIFKSWFVSFDPVWAKVEALAAGVDENGAIRSAMATISGKTQAELDDFKDTHPDDYQRLYDAAQAFPCEMVDGVPLGWNILPIADKSILQIIKPKINKFDGEKSYIATANVSQNNIVGNLESITYTKRPSRANMQPVVGSIWFAKMVGEHKAIMVDEDDDFILTNTVLSTGFLGVLPKENLNSFLYCYINSERFLQDKYNLATGAVQVALNNTNFSSIEMLIPNESVLVHFENTVAGFFKRIAKNNRENIVLSLVRDNLLPKLLSGEIEL